MKPSWWVGSVLLPILVAWPASAPAAPRLVVTRDDTAIRESCDLVIPAGVVIGDANTNGVLLVEADDITIRFVDGSVLRGASPDVPGDRLRGIGIRVDGRRGVKIEGARVEGYFNGLVATRADGLVVDGGEFSGNYRQRLRSTPEAEDGADWLFPHHNDERKWRDEYGGAICVEASDRVVIRGVTVRRGQNGFVLDRVNDSEIYDNDASFLSGWGLALWRSSRNVVGRNAFDFCVRGHVEGVYNRGQDSAGILCFEQSNDNVFAENSVTHGGDGFFGFAGREALGETWMEAERARLRRETGREEVDDLIRVPPEVARDFAGRGCNRNVLYGNDFSYAAAHGIEMTFSEGNVFARNRLVENAICGVWGGYSSATLIVGNHFEGNGGMAYGLERGAINMEHASDNVIAGNTFLNDKCAIHLWWDDDAALLKSPGVAGNDRGVSGNVIAANRFVVDDRHPFRSLRRDDRLIVLQLRDQGGPHVRSNRYVGNTVTLSVSNAVEFAVTDGAEPERSGSFEPPAISVPRVPGRKRPVGARPELRGRGAILMDEWGPWDHREPFLRSRGAVSGGSGIAYEVFGLAEPPRVTVRSGRVTTGITALTDRPRAWRVSLNAPPGVTSYDARVEGAGWHRDLTGTLVAARWEAVFFSWKPEVDPRSDLEGWRRLAEGTDAVRVTMGALDLPYGWGGPRDQAERMQGGEEVRRRGPGNDRFGMMARTRLPLPKGEWRVRTLSDDGVRVTVGGRKVVENWTWHGPTPDEGRFRQETDGEVEVVVEHFEIDGYAVLRLEIERTE